VGDVGDARHHLNAPLWVGYVSFVVGLVGTFLLGRVAMLRFLSFNVMKAMLKMTKLDIKGLQRAYEQG
jgi:hypothetical protein